MNKGWSLGAAARRISSTPTCKVHFSLIVFVTIKCCLLPLLIHHSIRYPIHVGSQYVRLQKLSALG